MKDYYYILGINETASPEEIKKAYRKLSTKFHPDKNDGDEFFASRFKEILEAYEILVDPIKRAKYDEEKILVIKSKSGVNFTPEIEVFKVNKQEIEFDEEVIFTWKTINADKVTLKPFGIVPPIGQKTYRIRDFKHRHLSFELIAENTNIERGLKALISLNNKTYQDLYNHYKSEIEKEILASSRFKSEVNSNSQRIVTYQPWRIFANILIFLIVIGGIVALIIWVDNTIK